MQWSCGKFEISIRNKLGLQENEATGGMST